MKQAIIIVTCNKSNKTFLPDLLQSIVGTKYPIIIYNNMVDTNEFEIGAIKFAIDFGIDEFFLLHDSVIIKNIDLFDIVFNKYSGSTVYLGSNFMSFLGKYRSEVLKTLELPSPKTRLDSCVAEFNFLPKYLDSEPNKVELFPDFWKQPEKFEFKHGRENMVIDNDYLIKYKGHWTSSMLYDD